MSFVSLLRNNIYLWIFLTTFSVIFAVGITLFIGFYTFQKNNSIYQILGFVLSMLSLSSIAAICFSVPFKYHKILGYITVALLIIGTVASYRIFTNKCFYCPKDTLCDSSTGLCISTRSDIIMNENTPAPSIGNQLWRDETTSNSQIACTTCPDGSQCCGDNICYQHEGMTGYQCCPEDKQYIDPTNSKHILCCADGEIALVTNDGSFPSTCVPLCPPNNKDGSSCRRNEICDSITMNTAEEATTLAESLNKTKPFGNLSQRDNVVYGCVPNTDTQCTVLRSITYPDFSSLKNNEKDIDICASCPEDLTTGEIMDSMTASDQKCTYYYTSQGSGNPVGYQKITRFQLGFDCTDDEIVKNCWGDQLMKQPGLVDVSIDKQQKHCDFVYDCGKINNFVNTAPIDKYKCFDQNYSCDLQGRFYHEDYFYTFPAFSTQNPTELLNGIYILKTLTNNDNILKPADLNNLVCGQTFNFSTLGLNICTTTNKDDSVENVQSNCKIQCNDSLKLDWNQYFVLNQSLIWLRQPDGNPVFVSSLFSALYTGVYSGTVNPDTMIYTGALSQDIGYMSYDNTCYSRNSDFIIPNSSQLQIYKLINNVTDESNDYFIFSQDKIALKFVTNGDPQAGSPGAYGDQTAPIQKYFNTKTFKFEDDSFNKDNPPMYIEKYIDKYSTDPQINACAKANSDSCYRPQEYNYPLIYGDQIVFYTVNEDKSISYMNCDNGNYTFQSEGNKCQSDHRSIKYFQWNNNVYDGTSTKYGSPLTLYRNQP